MSMPKRFTGTEKWEDRWFRSLKPVNKLLWLYLLDRCDMAGVIEFDLDLAEFYIGQKIDKSDFESNFRGRVFKISESKLWIPKFIEFQYGCSVQELRRDYSLHKGVLKSVDKYKLTEFFSFLESPDSRTINTPDRGIDTPMVEVEVKEEVNKGGMGGTVAFTDPIRESAWQRWLKYRKERKKPLTDSTIKQQLEFLNKQPDPIECIDQSIRNGWQGLFEVKNGQNGNRPTKAGGSTTDEDLRRTLDLIESRDPGSRPRGTSSS